MVYFQTERLYVLVRSTELGCSGTRIRLTESSDGTLKFMGIIPINQEDVRPAKWLERLKGIT